MPSLFRTNGRERKSREQFEQVGGRGFLKYSFLIEIEWSEINIITHDNLEINRCLPLFPIFFLFGEALNVIYFVFLFLQYIYVVTSPALQITPTCITSPSSQKWFSIFFLNWLFKKSVLFLSRQRHRTYHYYLHHYIITFIGFKAQMHILHQLFAATCFDA